MALNSVVFARLRGVLCWSGLLTALALLVNPAWAQGVGEPLDPDRSVQADFVSKYRLGPGDILTVSVLGEEDLSAKKLRLPDTGVLSLPAVGDVPAMGKTLSELEALIVQRLKGRILINPQVSISVDEYRPFFINGMVDKPGGYPFLPGLTVRKAAALAGGFKERASLKKIFLIREADKLQTPVNVDLNTLVMPGDIVTVEESFF